MGKKKCLINNESYSITLVFKLPISHCFLLPNSTKSLSGYKSGYTFLHTSIDPGTLGTTFKCPLTRGVRVLEESAYGRYPLGRGVRLVRLGEASAYGRCPLRRGVRLGEESA